MGENSLRVTEAAFNQVAHLAHCGLVIDNGKESGMPELIRAFAGEVSQSGDEIGGFEAVEDIFFEGELHLPLPALVEPQLTEGGTVSMPLQKVVIPTASFMPRLSLGALGEVPAAKNEGMEGELHLPLHARVEPLLTEVGTRVPTASLVPRLSLGALRELPGAKDEGTQDLSESTSHTQQTGRQCSTVSEVASFATTMSPSSLKSNKTVKTCGKCKAPYSGFGTMCSTCRKYGAQGSIKQCVKCSAFFNGFGDICDDCGS